jgi:hypothetical protein
MIGESLAVKVFVRQAIGLEHRAHRAVEDQDAFLQERFDGRL